MATPMVIDFNLVDYDRDPMPVPPIRDKNGRCKLMTRKQLRTRIRRQKARGRQPTRSAEYKRLYKPIEEWDKEELARGRPRNRDGHFGGRAPAWITRELHEEALSRFKAAVKDELQSSTVTAMSMVNIMLNDVEVDDRGRPVTPAAVKADLAKWLIEQVVGKPKQHTQTDISVKMQGVLASAIVTPDTLPAMPNAKGLTSPRDALDVEGWEDGD